MLVNLGEADPESKEFGLQHKQHFVDAKVHRDENHKRCMRWLEGVQVTTMNIEYRNVGAHTNVLIDPALISSYTDFKRNTQRLTIGVGQRISVKIYF